MKKKMYSYLLLSILLTSIAIISVESSSFTGTFVFGYDRDLDGTVDNPYGFFKLNIWCQDSFSEKLYVMITVEYIKNQSAIAEYIYLTNLTIMLLDENGNHVASKIINKTSNIFPGYKRQILETLKPPSKPGNYYVAVNFTLHWSFQGNEETMPFTLLGSTPLEALPETVYSPPSGGNWLIWFVAVPVALGILGVVLGYVFSKKKAVGGKKSGLTSSGTYSLEQTRSGGEIVSEETVLVPESDSNLMNNLKCLTHLGLAARTYILEFYIKLKTPHSSIVETSFEASKGVKILKIVEHTGEKSYIEKTGRTYRLKTKNSNSETYRFTVFILKPVGISLEKNIKAKINIRSKDAINSIEIHPNEKHIDPIILAVFNVKRNLSNAVNALLKGIIAIQDAVKDFAVYTAEAILPKLSIHDMTITNVSEEKINKIEADFHGKPIRVIDANIEDLEINQDKGTINVIELDTKQTLHLTVITPRFSEKDEIIVRLQGKEITITGGLEGLEETGIALFYSRTDVHKLTKTYHAIATILKNIEKAKDYI